MVPPLAEAKDSLCQAGFRETCSPALLIDCETNRTIRLWAWPLLQGKECKEATAGAGRRSGEDLSRRFTRFLRPEMIVAEHHDGKGPFSRISTRLSSENASARTRTGQSLPILGRQPSAPLATTCEGRRRTFSVTAVPRRQSCEHSTLCP